MNSLDFDGIDPGDWIDSLPQHYAETIRAMVASGDTYERVAEVWLSKAGADNTFFLGAAGQRQTYYDRVKEEFSKLICDHPDYSLIRADAKKQWNDKKLVICMPLAAAVGAKLGIAAAALLPVIALLLAAVTKVGKNAWCASP